MPDTQTIPPTEVSLRRIRRVLNDSRDLDERQIAARQLFPLLWDRLPWRRYAAGCVLTTRVYLPATLFMLEWPSFPNVLTRELRRNRYAALPDDAEAQRDALAHTLRAILARWHDRYTPERRPASPPLSIDVAADVCEAIGRLGIVEAEADLLRTLRSLSGDSNQVRSASLLALAVLPPARLTQTWQWLNEGNPVEKRLIGAVLAYMTLPDAVPFLLQALPGIATDADLHSALGIPLLLALGRIGDPRALPALNDLARAPGHPLQPTARKAIQRVMKEAEGHEEVTLVRASGAHEVGEDSLLRPSSESATPARPELLLRAAGQEKRSSIPSNRGSGSTEGKE